MRMKRSHKSKVQGPKSKVQGPKSKVREPKRVVRSQGSEKPGGEAWESAEEQGRSSSVDSAYVLTYLSGKNKGNCFHAGDEHYECRPDLTGYSKFHPEGSASLHHSCSNTDG